MNTNFFEAIVGMAPDTVISVERNGKWYRPKINGAHNVSDISQNDFAADAKIRVFEDTGIIIKSGVFNDVLTSSISGFASCDGQTVQAESEADAVIVLAEKLWKRGDVNVSN